MKIKDPDIMEIVKNKIPVAIGENEFLVEPNPIGSCDGCYFINKNCPTKARYYCCSNGGNILVFEKHISK